MSGWKQVEVDGSREWGVKRELTARAGCLYAGMWVIFLFQTVWFCAFGAVSEVFA